MRPDLNPYAPPSAAAERTPGDGYPLGWQVGGAALILNALRNIIAQLFVQDLGFFLVALDLLLGVALLLKKSRWRKFALARLVFAGLVPPARALAEGTPVLAGTAFGLSLFTVLLLVGRPSLLRIVLVSIGFLVCTVTSVLVLLQTAP